MYSFLYDLQWCILLVFYCVSVEEKMSCMCSELCSARHAIVLSVCLVCRWSPVWGVGIIFIKMFLNKYESIMMLPPVEKCISCCLSHQNPATYLFRAVLAFKQCLICADFSPDSHQNTFSLEEALWIMDSCLFKNILMRDLSHLLSSQDVNWWTGVVWIIVMFLSVVWTLILTAPIHYKVSIAERVM